jgi:hypothetical protein
LDKNQDGKLSEDEVTPEREDATAKGDSVAAEVLASCA